MKKLLIILAGIVLVGVGCDDFKQHRITCEENGGLYLVKKGFDSTETGWCFNPWDQVHDLEEKTVKIPLEKGVTCVSGLCLQGASHNIPLHEAVQLLIDAGGYKYIPATTEEKPARFVK